MPNEENKILITTTVGLNTDVSEPQKVIHLVVGDYGTRKLRLVPVSNGSLIDVNQAAQAKVRLQSSGQAALLIDCVIGDHYADLIPTQAMVAEADEWAAQLVLLDELGHTISSCPFVINVHGTVYTGDAVEHTSNGVVAVYYDNNGCLALQKESGDTISTPGYWVHTHDLVRTPEPGDEEDEGKAGFMSVEDKVYLESLKNSVNQGVRTTDSPTFAGLTIGTMTIDAQGTITGARFA